MNDVPTWLSIVLYAVGAIALAGVLYLLMLTAMRHVLREPLAELRTARRRQEDLLREISTSATYVADVADVWAESEAERRAAAESEADARAASGDESQSRAPAGE
jgi:hypothetical protein